MRPAFRQMRSRPTSPLMGSRVGRVSPTPAEIYDHPGRRPRCGGGDTVRISKPAINAVCFAAWDSDVGNGRPRASAEGVQSFLTAFHPMDSGHNAHSRVGGRENFGLSFEDIVARSWR